MPERRDWNHTTGTAWIWDAKSASRWMLLALMLVSCCANAAGQVASASPGPGDLRVRPCTRSEVAFGSSAEVAELIRRQSNEAEPPTFSWCEAVEVGWFPKATILRFHTAIDVDYSRTYTVIRAGEGSTIHVIGSAEGLVAQRQPGAPADVRAFNDLLRAAPQPFSTDRLESACVLYLFLVGKENRSSFFRHPQAEHLIATAGYHPRKLADGNRVRLTSRAAQWDFVFTRQGGRAQVKAVLMGVRLPD